MCVKFRDESVRKPCFAVFTKPVDCDQTVNGAAEFVAAEFIAAAIVLVLC